MFTVVFLGRGPASCRLTQECRLMEQPLCGILLASVREKENSGGSLTSNKCPGLKVTQVTGLSARTCHIAPPYPTTREARKCSVTNIHRISLTYSSKHLFLICISVGQLGSVLICELYPDLVHVFIFFGLMTTQDMFSWSRKRQPTPVSLPGKSMDRGAWQATVQGATESGTTEHSTAQLSTTYLCHG